MSLRKCSIENYINEKLIKIENFDSLGNKIEK